ncbi:MAG: sugar phosphate nucleotidyltransferase [Cyclobacteriaceae bacterium]
MTLLILAAGLGNRYGGTKQFDGVGPQGEFLLEYTIYDAIKAGFSRLVLVTRHELVQEITDYFKARLPRSIDFECIAQLIEDTPEGFETGVDRAKPWGTAHAIWCARKVIREQFVTVNADDLYGRNAIDEACKLGSQLIEKDQFGLVGFQLKDTLSRFGSVSRGVCSIANGLLIKVTEYVKIASNNQQILDEELGVEFTGSELVSMNLWILQPSVFSEIETAFPSYFDETSKQESDEIYLPQVIQNLIDANVVTVHAAASRSGWYGLTHKEDKAQLEIELMRLTKREIYPTPLWS